MRKLTVLISLALLLATVLGASEAPYAGPELRLDYRGPVLVDNSQLRYPPSEKLAFRTEDHLARNAEHLLPLRPALDTWAARLGVHPRILIAVVEAAFGTGPVAGSRNELDTVAQLASALATAFEQAGDQPLAATKAVRAVADAFALPLELPADLALERSSAVAVRGSGPPLFGFFQPPWEIGDTWAGGGAHGDTGSGLQNALDFWGEFRNWGEDVSQWLVAATQAGTARVWSSCGMSIIHGNGWETGLYHLDNIRVADFQTVGRNTELANYADNLAQATCAGGSSSGPHVHMAISFQGERVLIDEVNIDFTAFSHHVGVGQYDTDCSRSFYSHETLGTICPNFDQLRNDSPDPGGLLFADGFESGSTSAWSGTT